MLVKRTVHGEPLVEVLIAREDDGGAHVATAEGSLSILSLGILRELRLLGVTMSLERLQSLVPVTTTPG